MVYEPIPIDCAGADVGRAEGAGRTEARPFYNSILVLFYSWSARACRTDWYLRISRHDKMEHQ